MQNYGFKVLKKIITVKYSLKKGHPLYYNSQYFFSLIMDVILVIKGNTKVLDLKLLEDSELIL